MTREEHKKMLIVEGLMHRLEIVHALHQVQEGTRAKLVLGRLPGLLALIGNRNALPLLGAVMPLVLGKNGVSRFVRRILMVAGAGAGIAALVKRWKARAA